MNSSQLSIIVCTRNRPLTLNKLLVSIGNSLLKPLEVIIISSGEEISNIVSKHANSFKIKHFHTVLVGQSNQKKIAFEYLDEKSKWVFFLDDDLEITPTTINRVIERIVEVDGVNVDGIGTKLLTSPDKFLKPLRLVSSFSLPLGKGKIMNSGKANKYMFRKRIETEWLNGASVWRKSSLINYNIPILNSRYAAYEDVIFSTNVAKHSKLLYEPSIEVIEQTSHSQPTVNLAQFKYITLWTGYLVCTRKESKLNSFKILTIARTIRFVYMAVKHRSGLNLLTITIFLKDILFLPKNKDDAKTRILEAIKNEAD
jgi:glycosyltransferase involved in cell wall biosynthesis